MRWHRSLFLILTLVSGLAFSFQGYVFAATCSPSPVKCPSGQTSYYYPAKSATCSDGGFVCKKTVSTMSKKTATSKPVASKPAAPAQSTQSVAYNGSCPVLTRTLSRGMKSAEVSALQKFLVSQGLLSSDGATGFFGTLSGKAVSAYQRSQGLEAAGTVGARTRAAIRACTKSSIGTKPITVALPGPFVSPPPSSGPGGSNPNTCTPGQSQTQTVDCPTGQVGAITQSRTSTCPGPQWSTWSTTANTCQGAGPNACTLDSVTVNNGDSRAFFSMRTVSFGNTCSTSSRTCASGTFGGDVTYQYARCSVDAGANCTFNNTSVAHDASVTAYQSQSVSVGQTCVSESRTCTNGTLGGSYQYAACTVQSDPFVAGYPAGPFFHSYGYSTKIVKEIASTGIHVYNIDTNLFGDDTGFSTPVSTADGVWDFSKLTDMMDMIVKADPQAKFVLRPAAGAPDWWKDANPNELIQNQTGSAQGRFGRYGSLFSDPLRGRWTTGAQMLKNALAEKGLDTRVIGLVATGETSQEWINDDNLFNVYSNIQPLVYGPRDRAAFGAWSAQRGTNCDVPTVAQFQAATYIGNAQRSMFLNPSTDGCVIEFYRYRSQSKIDAIDFVTRLLKRTFPQRQIGVIYGYFNEMVGNPTSGHGALGKLLSLASIDYINPMPSYLDRLTPGTQLERQPFSSVSLHGKKLFTDLDQGSSVSKINYDLLCESYRTSSDPHLHEVWIVNCDSGDPRSLYNYQMSEAAFPVDVATTLSNWKNFLGFSLGRGVSYSYLSLHNWIENKDTDKSYISDPGLISGVRELNIIKTQAASFPATSVAEVLVVTDEDSANYTRYAEAGLNKANSLQTPGDMSLQSLSVPRLGLSRMGAPYDHVLLSDLGSVDTSKYKMVVFLNAWSVDSAMRATIANKLKNGGRTLVFNYAAGLYKDGVKNAANIKDLVGVNVETNNQLYKPAITTDTSQYQLFNQVHTIAPSFSINVDYFYPADGSAYVIGKQTNGAYAGSPSMAIRDFQTWKSLWTPTVALSPAAFRDIATSAGVNIYSNTDDPVYINASYATLAAKTSGNKTLSFPSAVMLYDTNGALLQSGKRTYSFYAASGEVKIFRYTIDTSAPVDVCDVNVSTGGPTIASWSGPTRMRVYQRNGGVAQVPVGVTLTTDAECVRARVRSASGAEVVPWTTVSKGTFGVGQSVSGSITTPGGGWYFVDVQGIKANKGGPIGTTDYIGVGEVFVIAGQSNSTFFGQTPQHSATGKVVYFDGANWSLCQDPLSVVDPQSAGGSPWCLIGDDIVNGYGTPVAMMPTGWGGTNIEQWQKDSPTSPNGPGVLYARLVERMRQFGPNGVRALLWHQGESDAALGTSGATYASKLQAIIDGTRSNGGFTVPWIIAQVAYPGGTAAQQAELRSGQQSLVNGSTIFAGPNTDTLGAEYRYDGTHFTVPGLQAEEQLWDGAISSAMTVIAK